MAKKEHVYELIDNSQGGKVIAEFWWTGRKVECTKPDLIESIAAASYSVTPSEGIKFLNNLPNVFRNGYLQIKKKKESDDKQM